MYRGFVYGDWGQRFMMHFLCRTKALLLLLQPMFLSARAKIKGEARETTKNLDET